MSCSCRFVPVLLSLLLPAFGAAQTGADGLSHIPIPRAGDSDPNKLFAERMGQTKLRNGLADILKQMPAGSLGPNSRDQLEKLLNERPELRDALEGLKRNQPEGQSQLQGIIGELLNRPEFAGRGLNPKIIEQQLKNLSIPDRERPRAGGPPSNSRGAPPSTQVAEAIVPPPDINPQDKAARQAWARSIADWAQRFPQDKLTGPLGNSPAVRNLFRDLTQAGADAMRGGGGNAGLDAELAAWEHRLKSVRDWLPQDWAKGIGDRISNLPRPDIQMPNLDWSPPAMGSPSIELSAPTIDAGGLGSIALIVLALGLTAVVLWRLRVGQSRSPERTWRRSLGPWPLDPETVATRADVIQAFEYLSLVRCGEAARTWHHRAIAMQLGGAEAESDAAASQLAQLYEHARYAPAGLPEPDWTAARRPLTFLSRTGAI